jgi:hypothetical protein
MMLANTWTHRRISLNHSLKSKSIRPSPTSPATVRKTLAAFKHKLVVVPERDRLGRSNIGLLRVLNSPATAGVQALAAPAQGRRPTQADPETAAKTASEGVCSSSSTATLEWRAAGNFKDLIDAEVAAIGDDRTPI